MPCQINLKWEKVYHAFEIWIHYISLKHKRMIVVPTVKNKVQASRIGAAKGKTENTPQIIIDRIEGRRGAARLDHLV
jgi:hypothetical protein